MIVLEFKAKGKTTQYAAIDEAIKTAQFVALRAASPTQQVHPFLDG